MEKNIPRQISPRYHQYHQALSNKKGNIEWIAHIIIAEKITELDNKKMSFEQNMSKKLHLRILLRPIGFETQKKPKKAVKYKDMNYITYLYVLGQM